MRLATSSSQRRTPEASESSGSSRISRNHGRPGLVMPDIIPAVSTPSARVPVLSMIRWLIGDPRVAWFGVISHL